MISTIFPYLKTLLILLSDEKFVDLCLLMFGTIHLRRRQIFTIFDPYPPTIGIPAKCLWRGFFILIYCDLLTIGTWGHPFPPKTCWRLKWMVPNRLLRVIKPKTQLARTAYAKSLIQIYLFYLLYNFAHTYHQNVWLMIKYWFLSYQYQRICFMLFIIKELKQDATTQVFDLCCIHW